MPGLRVGTITSEMVVAAGKSFMVLAESMYLCV